MADPSAFVSRPVQALRLLVPLEATAGNNCIIAMPSEKLSLFDSEPDAGSNGAWCRSSQKVIADARVQHQ
jgi:hypothetical protein